MLYSFRVALMIAVIALATLPAYAESGVTSNVVVLPNGNAGTSMIQVPDGSLWLNLPDIATGRYNYIAHLSPNGRISYFSLPFAPAHNGRRSPLIPLGLAIAPAIRGPRIVPLQYGAAQPSPLGRTLVFNWAALTNPDQTIPDESGFGTINTDNPSQIAAYSAQFPGDPLYTPGLALEPYKFATLATNSPPAVWAYAHASPAASPFPEYVVSFPYPLRSAARAKTFPIVPSSNLVLTAFSSPVLGADGNVWFQGSQQIGRISPLGVTNFSLSLNPLTMVSGGNGLWLSGVYTPSYSFGVTQTSYTGVAGPFVAANPAPYNYQLLASAPDAVWSLARSPLGAILFVRISTSGQFSAYVEPSPLPGADIIGETDLTITRDGTLWGGFFESNDAYSSALVSFKSSRVISAEPLFLGFTGPGQSTTVTVAETNYPSGTFTGTAYRDCPITISAGTTPGTFVVSTVSESEFSLYNCGVSFFDSDGNSVWVPVSTSGVSDGSPRDLRAALQRRQALLEEFPPFRPFWTALSEKS